MATAGIVIGIIDVVAFFAFQLPYLF